MGDANDPQTHQHSQDKTSPQAWLVAVVLAATVILLAIAAFLAWRTTQTPFPGMFTEPTLVVTGMGDHTWSGYAAGLEYRDHLIAFNGRLLDTTTALMRELSLHGYGDVVALTARDVAGALRDVSVRLGPIPTEALVGFFVLPYVLGLTYLGIGIWVFLARRQWPHIRRSGWVPDWFAWQHRKESSMHWNPS